MGFPQIPHPTSQIPYLFSIPPGGYNGPDPKFSPPAEQMATSWVIQLIQASQGTLSASYLPYSIGLLQAYCMRHAGDLRRYTFLPLIADREPIEMLVPRIRMADVFGFSC